MHGDMKEPYTSDVVELSPEDQTDFRGTSEDAHDMHRLGKKQEFQVCTFCVSLSRMQALTNYVVEKFQLSDYPGVYFHIDVHMGGLHSVSESTHTY